MAIVLKAQAIVTGSYTGEILKSSQSISFWGGVDPHTGLVCDPRHELFGQSVSGKILVFPFGKGSSTGSLILLELVRTGKAPGAMVNVKTEPILATGPIVCKYFYRKDVPIVTVESADFDYLQTGLTASVDSLPGQATISL